MKRQKLQRLLEAYSPLDQEEISAKKKMLEFLSSHENCFERSLEVGHFTGSAWLVNRDNTEVLLMHHAKLNIWCQLGGHADGDADLFAVALREAQEESGIFGVQPLMEAIFDIDIHPIPGNSKEKAHFHYDVRFIFQVVSNEQIVQNAESKALKWFGRELEALPTRHRSITRMFDKWTQRPVK